MTELIETLDSSAADRRISRRYQPTFGTTCRLTESRQHGLVWDISTEGLGLLLGFSPAEGEAIPIELGTDVARERLLVQVRVAHVRKLSTGDFFIGAKFDRPLTPTEIEPFTTPVLGRPHLSVKAGPKSKKLLVPTAN